MFEKCWDEKIQNLRIGLANQCWIRWLPSQLFDVFIPKPSLQVANGMPYFEHSFLTLSMRSSLISPGRYLALFIFSPCLKYNGFRLLAVSGNAFSNLFHPSYLGLNVLVTMCLTPASLALSTISSISSSVRKGKMGSSLIPVGIPALVSSLIVFSLFSGSGAFGSSLLYISFFKVVMVKVTADLRF